VLEAEPASKKEGRILRRVLASRGDQESRLALAALRDLDDLTGPWPVGRLVDPAPVDLDVAVSADAPSRAAFGASATPKTRLSLTFDRLRSTISP
jgi:hypothetical protein